MDRYSQEQSHFNISDFSAKAKKKDCKACTDFNDWITSKKSKSAALVQKVIWKMELSLFRNRWSQRKVCLRTTKKKKINAVTALCIGMSWAVIRGVYCTQCPRIILKNRPAKTKRKWSLLLMGWLGFFRVKSVHRTFKMSKIAFFLHFTQGFFESLLMI